MKLKQKLGYLIDSFITKGTGNLMLALFVVTMSIIVILGLIAAAIDRFQEGPIFYIWAFVNHTIDVGNLYGVEPERGPLYIAVATVATLIGIIVLSLVISFISNGFETKISELSKGRGKVLEKNHTLILGFDKSVPIMVEELIIANENFKRGIIVILSNLIPEEVFKIINETVKDFKNTKIIVRNGNINQSEDLAMVAIKDAKAIIIAANTDIETIKTLITIKQSEFKDNAKAHIVTQIFNQKNIDIAKKIMPGKIETVYVHDLKARIFARTCIQPGSSMIYKDLFSFEGSEIYFEAITKELTKLVGHTFEQAVLQIKGGYLIGISRENKQLVNPDPKTKINATDELIVIAEDDGAIKYSNNSNLEQKILATKKSKLSKPLNLLILGFSKGLTTVLKEIDAYGIEKEKLLIMVESESDRKELLKVYSKSSFEDFKVVVGKSSERQDLAKVKLSEFQVACVFANNHNTERSDEDLDADTLLKILHLHDLEVEQNIRLNLVTEILNETNVNTFQSINVDDFMISNLLLSRIITQISENRKTNDVIIDLISEDGSELYLKSAYNYVPLNQPINCFSILKEANKKKQIFIGYKLYKQNPVINPPLDAIIKFEENDAIIVVSED